MGGYIVYDKFLSKNAINRVENNSKNEVKSSEENSKNEIKSTENKQTNEIGTENNNYIKTRTCVGVYSGIAALTKDALTGEYDRGTLTLNLKEDGTYELKNEYMSLGSEAYTIIDNTLLLKTTPHICGPDMNCSPKYSDYLSISEDCSEISWGYESYFLDPDFTLKKQN